MSDRRRVVLEAARQLFASKGYAATSIADIEAASGYQPRTGGLYRHFPSKAAILEELIDRGIAENGRAILDVPDPEAGASPRDVLEQVARRALGQLDRQADLLRITFRDLDAFPALRRRLRESMVAATHTDFSTRLAKAHAQGLLPAVDFDAVAAIAVGSLVNLKIRQHVLGDGRADVPDDRIVAAWVDIFLAYLAPGSEAAKRA